MLQPSGFHVFGEAGGKMELSQIGRFYNGRHHTRVLHAIEKIEQLRRTDEAVDASVDVLTAALAPESPCETLKPAEPPSQSLLIEAVASRVIDRLAELRQDIGIKNGTF
jgi:hypothetical protein